MLLKIISNQPLEDDVYHQVVSIIRQSHCYHESLVNTFPGYYQKLIDFGDEIHIYFDSTSSSNYEYEQTIII